MKWKINVQESFVLFWNIKIFRTQLTIGVIPIIHFYRRLFVIKFHIDLLHNVQIVFLTSEPDYIFGMMHIDKCPVDVQ